MKDYVLTLLVAAAATYMLTPLVRRMAAQIGAMKQPRERDVHVVPVATLGGLAMYGGLVAGLLVSEQIPQLRQQAFTNTGMLNGLLLAGGLLVVIGFIDDRWGMGALTKGAGQVAAGAILVATGTTLSWFPLPGGNTFLPDTDQRTVLTILIVVATINAVNFIDGLDGLASGIVGIAAVSFFIYYYSLTRVIHMTALAAPALASAILIGMCIGFLPHNFSPAKIFMGDTGSMLLGLLLAYAPISCINSLPEGNLTSEANRYPVILPLLLPAALLIIPYADLLLAVVRRTRAGRSPFAPDRKHLHHRLLDIGHSQRTSVLIMYLWAALFSGSVVWLSVEKTVQPKNAGHHGEPIFVFVLITVAAVAALLLMSMPRLRWWQRARAAGEDAGRGVGPAPAGALAPELEPAAAGAQPYRPEATAGSRLAAVSGHTVSASPVSASPVSASPVSASPVSTSTVSADGLSSNGLSSNGLSSNGHSPNGHSPNGTSASGVTVSLGARESLAPSLRSEPLPSAAPLAAPPRTDPLLLEPTGPVRAEHVESPAFRQPTDQGSADAARSIIGTVPPAVTRNAPVPPELRRPGAAEYSDNGWQLSDPEFP